MNVQNQRKLGRLYLIPGGQLLFLRFNQGRGRARLGYNPESFILRSRLIQFSCTHGSFNKGRR